MVTLIHAKRPTDDSSVGVVIIMCDYYSLGSCDDSAIGFIPDDEEGNEGASHFLCGRHADEVVGDEEFVRFTKLP